MFSTKGRDGSLPALFGGLTMATFYECDFCRTQTEESGERKSFDLTSQSINADPGGGIGSLIGPFDLCPKCEIDLAEHIQAKLDPVKQQRAEEKEA